MRPMILLLMLLSAASFALADGVSSVVSLPRTDYYPGDQVQFTLFFYNDTDQAQSLALAERVVCVLESGGQSKSVGAVLQDPGPASDIPLPAKSFIKSGYAFTLPDEMGPAVRLRLVDYSAAAVAFSILPSKSRQVAGPAEPAKKRHVQDPSLADLHTLYQPYVENMSTYEPIYFLVGSDPAQSKFQISFKYLFFDEHNSLGEKYPWLQGLHFGYTQTSFWDLASASAPFEDTSYKPELFYISENISARPAWMKGFFIQAGGRHESNGRDGRESRSTNTLYLKPIVILFDQQSRLGLQIAPRFNAYVGNDDTTNQDLPDYRGYFELELKLGKADGAVLGSSLRLADRGASIQLDLTYPLHLLWENGAGIYLQAQYANTLAESLIDYDQRTHAVRFGLAIVR